MVGASISLCLCSIADTITGEVLLFTLLLHTTKSNMRIIQKRMTITIEEIQIRDPSLLSLAMGAVWVDVVDVALLVDDDEVEVWLMVEVVSVTVIEDKVKEVVVDV